MSVTNAKDTTIQDLFGADARRGAATRNKDQDRAKQDAPQDATTVASQFSELLKNRMSTNFASARADQSLELPQRASADRDEAPVVERRKAPERRDDRDDPETAERPDDAHRDQPVAAAVTNPEIQNPLPVAAENAGDVDVTVEAEAAPVQADAAAGTAAKGKAEAGAEAQAAVAGTTDKKTPKAAAADAAQPEDITPEMVEAAKEAAKKGKGKATATVTDADAKLTSQPQTTLSAKAAVDAAAGERKTANGQLTASADADAETAQAEEGANTIFNRIKAQNTPSGAKAAAEAAAAGKGATDGADVPKPTAAAQMPTPANQNVQPGFGLGRTAGDPQQTSSLTGTSQSGTTVDSATGGAATLGANNSIQQRSTAPNTANTPRAATMPNPALTDQVAVNIQKGAAQGQDKITVQLRPAELGKVEVKMEVTHDGKMTAVVSAERPETLDMLRQDARHLLQSLNDAGFQADQNSLSFSLQGQDTGGGNQGGDGRSQNASGMANGDDDLIQSGFIFEEAGGFRGDGRLDVRI